MSDIITVGLDLAKTVFQVHGADGAACRPPRWWPAWSAWRGLTGRSQTSPRCAAGKRPLRSGARIATRMAR